MRIEPLTGARAGRGGEGGGGDSVTPNLNVQGGLGNLSRQEVKDIVKSAYLEVATRGNSVRRINASQSKRSLYQR